MYDILIISVLYLSIQHVSAQMSALEEVSIPASTASKISVTSYLSIQTMQQQIMQMIQLMMEMMKTNNQKSKQRNPNL